MANNYKDKITMKFNVNQLERIIIALINNGYNKKFASNVKRLFAMFNPNLYKSDYDKEIRVYLINEIVDIITKNNIEDKNSILAYLDTDGKYYNDSVEILDYLYEQELTESEMSLLDTMISTQLRYGSIIPHADILGDKLVDLKAENYDDLETIIMDLEQELTTITRDIKSARESIENSKNDMNLSSNGFIGALSQVIKEERNPAIRVKTGIQYLNSMLNGGFERGRLYCAMGVAKG